MSGLPSFFQQRGKTVLDELADYELGGELDEEDDRNSAIEDAAFTDGYSGSDLELPSFFQPSTRDNESSLKIDSSSDGRSSSRSEDFNLSNLLSNFSWPNKDGTQKSEQSLDSDTETAGLIGRLQSVGLQSTSNTNPTAIQAGAPLMRPPHEYYEMLARSSGTPLDMPPSIPFPSNGPPHYNQMGGPLGGPSPPLGFNQHNQPMGPPYFTGPGGPMAMPRSAAGQGRPAQFDSNQPDFYQGGHNALFVRGPPEGTPFRGPPEGMSNRGPPSADPRLHFVGSGQRPPPPQHPHPNSLPQDPSLQPFQIGQQYPPGQPQPLPSYMQPNMPAPPLLHPQMRPDLDHNRLRMGHAGLQGGRGPAQVFQQMAAATAGAESTGKTGYPKSEMMTSSDVRFVVTKVVQPLETNDPYSDDYYFLQTNYKKNAKQAEAALIAGEPAPRPVYLPFPAWLETKNRIATQLEDTRKNFGDRSREWEEKEQVLGHMQRTDVTRPRELLHAPTLQEMLEMDSDIDGDGVFRMPFVSRLWNMRQAVQKGYEALYTLQELNHLLQSPLIAADHYASSEILQQIDRAVSLLSQSVGIRPAPEGSLRTSGGGLGAGAGGGPEIALEGGLVAAILQTAKGKKLMSRSINLLIPEQRWALLPVILARVLQSDPTEQSTDEQGVEKKLLQTLVQFIEHSHDFQKNQQALAVKGISAPFTTMLLGNLRLCVKSVMVSQMEKSRLRTTLKISRDRAVVMNVIVQIGDEVAKDAGETIATEWSQMREAFMCMLDE